MNKRQDPSAQASTLRIALLAVVFSSLALLLVVATPIKGRRVGRNPASPAPAVKSPIIGNYPNTTVELSGDTTVTPDSPPVNIASVNVSTSTNFKGRLEGDPMTGIVRVTDAHPAGTYAVTVKVFDSGGGSSATTFMLMVITPTTCSALSFSAATNFGAGDTPRSVALGDFNGDGKQDLATANLFSDNVSILLGNGKSGFGAPTNFSVAGGPFWLAVGDFNGDGRQDLAVANVNSDKVSILLGNGIGGFGAATSFDVGDSPTFVAIGDFNGDGKQDLAVPNYNSSNLSILLGDG